MHKKALAGRRVVVNRVDRHDMGVLEPREDPGLVTIGPRYLDGHQPAAQADFLGEVDPSECPTTQLENDAKPRQLGSRLKSAVSVMRTAFA